MLTNSYIKTSNWIKAKTADERGEMASWLVLAAALSAIAFGLKDTLKETIDGLADQVGQP